MQIAWRAPPAHCLTRLPHPGANVPAASWIGPPACMRLAAAFPTATTTDTAPTFSTTLMPLVLRCQNCTAWECWCRGSGARCASWGRTGRSDFCAAAAVLALGRDPVPRTPGARYQRAVIAGGRTAISGQRAPWMGHRIPPVGPPSARRSSSLAKNPLGAGCGHALRVNNKRYKLFIPFLNLLS